jgi:hypothetical protein
MGGSVRAIGAFPHLFFPKDFSQDLPHVRFGKLLTKLNQCGDFVFGHIFLAIFNDLFGVRLLRSNNLTAPGQAFRRLFGHGVEKFLTA